MDKCKNSPHYYHEWMRNCFGGLVQDICAYCGAVRYPFINHSHSSSYTVIQEVNQQHEAATAAAGGSETEQKECVMELKIDRVVIRDINNGVLVVVEYDENDEWIRETFFFDTNREVLAFLETNLD